jgi:hypothetical protein
MQLVTMAKEQFAKVQAAVASGNGSSQNQAKFTFLAMLLVGPPTGSAGLCDSGMTLPHQPAVAAALFYPRAASKDGVDRRPHMYVELICCNQPGRGYGTLLLQHIEHFVALGCEYMATGLLGLGAATNQAEITPAQSAVGAEQQCKGVMASGVQLNCKSGNAGGKEVITGQPGKTKSAASRVPAEGGFDTLLNSSISHNTLAMLPPTQQDLDVPHPELGNGVNASKTEEYLPARICGIRLLSVESAQAFYTKMGYSTPDPVCREMFKPLPAATADTCEGLVQESVQSVPRRVHY